MMIRESIPPHRSTKDPLSKQSSRMKSTRTLRVATATTRSPSGSVFPFLVLRSLYTKKGALFYSLATTTMAKKSNYLTWAPE